MKEKTRIIHEKEAVLFKKYRELRDAGYSKDSDECLDLQAEILELNWEFCLDKAQKSYKHLVASRGEEWSTAVVEVAIIIYMGMADALPNFDPSYGVYFSSFAEGSIKHAIDTFVQQDMNLKPYDADLTKKLDRASELMIRKYGTDNRPISDYEKETHLSTARIIRAQIMKTRAATVSMSTEDYANTMGLANEDANPEKQFIENTQTETLTNAISKLTPEQKLVIDMQFGFSDDKALSTRAIAKKINMSEYDVQNLIDSALLTIREDPAFRSFYGLDKEEKKRYTKADFEHTNSTSSLL